ncbi:MAG: STAS domain-containing protein [Streptosporangiaceae bacterium]|jgi:predicted amidohydrolase
MTPDASVVGVGKKAAQKRHSRHPQIELRHRVTSAGKVEVTISGHLGQSNAGRLYEYLEEILSEGQPVTVRLRKAACDRSGVTGLAMAANLATQVGCPFRVTGPATLLLLIATIADSGDIKVHWFRGSTLAWPAPVDVSRLPPIWREDDGETTTWAAS